MKIKKWYQWHNQDIKKEACKWWKLYIWSLVATVVFFIAAIIESNIWTNNSITAILVYCTLGATIFMLITVIYYSGIARADRLLKPKDIQEAEKNTWYLFN